MNYERIYNDFIADRRAKEPTLVESGEYFEKHHIVPRSLGGSDDASNLICLTIVDHILAHYYLAKWHGGTQWLAINVMVFSKKRQKHFELTEELLLIAAEARKAQANADATEYTFYSIKGAAPITCRRIDFPRKTKRGVDHYFLGDAKFIDSEWYTLERYGSHNKAKVAARPKTCHRSLALGRKLKRKRITNIDTGEVFASITQAAKTYGRSTSNINACLIGKVRTCSGQRFRYFNETEEQKARRKANIAIADEKVASWDFVARKTNVKCLDNGKVFSTVKEAAEWAEVGPSSISHACRGRSKTSGGYRWAYA